MKWGNVWVKISIITAIIVLIIFFIHRNSVLDKNPFGLRFLQSGEEMETYIRGQMGICNKNGAHDCYEQVASLFSHQFEYQKILRSIEKIQNYPEVFGRCHEIAHYIGRDAYKKTPDIKTLYQHSSPTCWGGFYHGVIEGYFENVAYLGEEEFAENIRSVCGSKSDYSVPRFFSECIHGIGHAMMFVSGHDLIKSLKWCDQLSESNLQNTCYGGVFMENSSSSTQTGSGHKSGYLKAEDPFYPCSILEEKYLPTCYTYQSSHFATLVKYDWKKNGELCLGVPSLYQNRCFHTIGTNQVGAAGGPEKMYGACNSLPEEFQPACFGGVVSGLAGRYVNEPEIIKEFCLLIRDEEKKNCWTAMGAGIASWSDQPSSLVLFCETDKEEYANWCKEGLSNPQKGKFLK